MGGIKNKLNNKLSNKLIKGSLSLKGDVRRKSDRGIVSDTNPLGSRLPSFSQPSEMLTRNTSNTRTSNWWSLYASKTIGSLRLVTLTKYLSITCLSLAILSTLILNIVSSYSSSKIESNAIDSSSELSTLAQATGPATISLSITPLTTPTSSPCDTSNSNICMKIPDDGGIATGGHTIKINTNSIAGWGMSLSTNNDGNLVNNENEANVIRSLPSTADIQHATTLSNNTWGIALPYGTNAQHYSPEANYLTSDKDTLASTLYSSVAYFSQSPDYLIAQRSDSTIPATETRNIYYGVRVDNPSQLLAGDYQTEVVYTATVKLPGEPTITGVSPNTYELGSGGANVVTIAGTNLSSAYDIYLQSQSDSTQKYSCTNIQVASDGKSLTCTLPTNAPLGTYDLYITTQGGTGSLANAFSYTESLPDGMDRVSDDYGADGHVAVDYDENMIPVVYDETAKTWRVVTNAELQQNPKNWYDYTKKQWANALTVSKSSLQSFRDKQTGVDSDPLIQTNNNPDILGYWVYIPRYAYEVQRRDAVDRVVDPQNFDIVFQTASEENAPALSCNSADKVWVNGKPVEDAGSNSTDILSKDYRTGCWPNNRTYVANSNDTTWATHPAFTWGDEPISGFWIGKFETTGTRVSPTVKPNQMANVDESFGSFVTMSKHIGAYDSDNTGGSDVVDGSVVLNIAGEWNSLHNLLSTTSHMLKNSEWGAVTYLTHSKFGAGINPNNGTSNTLRNGARPQSSTDADGEGLEWGATGCGPLNEKGNSYTSIDGVDLPALSANHIEDSLACGDADHAYNGSLGVYASTTNNVYGVYDMAGGAGEYVAGNLTDYPDRSYGGTIYDIIDEPMVPPYVDLYVTRSGSFGNFDSKPTWYPDSVTKSERYNFGACTFEACGGTATYETTEVQAVSDYYQGWGESNDMFVGTSGLWFLRGDYASMAGASLFTADSSMGYEFEWDSYRVALLPLLSVD